MNLKHRSKEPALISSATNTVERFQNLQCMWEESGILVGIKVKTSMRFSQQPIFRQYP